MYQIDVATAATSRPASTALGTTTGYFTDGNAATGVSATVVPAEFLNAMMLEIMGAVTGAGLTLSKSSFNQLYTAIQTIAQGGASNYAADTGTANTYQATYSPTVAAPADGMFRAFKVKTTNTGASTFALDGSATTYPIYGLGAAALAGGELAGGGIAVVRFNSSLATSGAWVLYHCSGGAQQVGAGSYLTSSPAQFDNSTKLSTTAFMQRALGNAQSTNSISASTTLTAANAGMLNGLFGSGGYTITLPAANSVRSGSTFWFMATTAVTIARAGTDGITLSGTFNAQASVAMKSGDTLGLVSDGTGAWFGISGSAMLQYADGPFGASKATSGYQKLPSGVIIQWGTGGYSGTSGGTGQWSYPIAFPNGTFAVVGTVGSALGQNALGFQAYSNSQMTIGYYNASGAAASGVGFSWMAIGY